MITTEQATSMMRMKDELIWKLKNELDINRNLLARMIRHDVQRVTKYEYKPKDSIQFIFEPEENSNIMFIKMVDFEEIKPMKSDYQRILELMEILEL